MAVEPKLCVREVHASGYRSLRAIRFPVDRLTVFIGPNGAGKTNLYRALQLLRAAAAGNLAETLAAEGGLAAAMWAGARNARQPAQIRLAVAFADASDPDTTLYRYEVIAGYPPPLPPGPRGAFPSEPHIKEETLSFHFRQRAITLLERRGPAVFGRDPDGKRIDITHDLMASETALGAFDEPRNFPELHGIRQTMLDWRFYHTLRTDTESRMRRPCLAVTSATLAPDGANLAAVLATLVHIRGDAIDLDRAIEDAFAGARLDVPLPGREASFGMIFPEHPRRVFQAEELSDGTLRYLALTGALLALRLPAFMAFNEPESSLHPDLLEPLARLIATASRRTQIWLVTHSERFAEALHRFAGVSARTVTKHDGATWIQGLMLSGSFRGEDEPA
jgi:predicted ATPase